MSTHNICLRGEIRKILTRYPLLSRPMSTHNIYLCGEIRKLSTLSVDKQNHKKIHTKKNKKNTLNLELGPSLFAV